MSAAKPILILALAVLPIAGSFAEVAPPRLLDKNKVPTKADMEQEREALRVIAEASNRLITRNGLLGVVDLVASKDRERIEQGLKKYNPATVSKASKEFKEAWHKKYPGEGFDAVKNFQMMIGQRVELREGENGRQYAFIYFPAFGGWQPFEMHLTRSKGDSWRIQLPNDLTGEQVIKEVEYDLQKLVADQDKWPADELTGYNNAVTQFVHAFAFPSDSAKK